MEMVRHTSDSEEHSIQLLHDTTNITMNRLLNVFLNPWIPVLGRKNSMVPKLVEILPQSNSFLESLSNREPSKTHLTYRLRCRAVPQGQGNGSHRIYSVAP